MNFEMDYDVKEYRPGKRKKRREIYDRENGMDAGAVQADPGVTLTTAEILDFSAGEDSRP